MFIAWINSADSILKPLFSLSADLGLSLNRGFVVIALKSYSNLLY